LKHFVLSSFMVSVCLAIANAQAQTPEPGVWWGIAPGVSIDERLQIEVSGTSLVVMSAPLGQAPVSWGPIAIAPDGTIRFRRANDPKQPCTLKRLEYGTYEGSCQESITRGLTLAKRGNPGGLEVPVGDEDLQILAKARQILSGASVWNRDDDRVCGDSSAKQSWSLYCALYQANLDVAGVNQHLRPVMQEARVAVLEVARRGFQRSLQDFNNLQSTTYADIVKVFDLTEQRLRTMKACMFSSAAETFAGFPSAATTAGGADGYWNEGIGYTQDGQTYSLGNILGPMDKPGGIPENWVAASTSVKRRSLPSDWRNAIDATGTLPNGHRWRYTILCGEVLQYNDAPADAASYFDRIIDGVHFR
jgi:hypothetical protein